MPGKLDYEIWARKQALKQWKRNPRRWEVVEAYKSRIDKIEGFPIGQDWEPIGTRTSSSGHSYIIWRREKPMPEEYVESLYPRIKGIQGELTDES